MTDGERRSDGSADAGGAGGAEGGPRPYDHVAVAEETAAVRRTPSDGGDAPAAGTFRVVGVGAEEVTLLRVTDAAGRRVNSGELVAVSRQTFDSLDSAENPDETGPLTTWGLAALGGLVAAVGAHPAVVAATGLSESAISAAGIAVFVVGLVRVLRTRR